MGMSATEREEQYNNIRKDYMKMANQLKLPKTANSSTISLSLDMVGGVGGSFLDDVGATDPTGLLADLTTPSPLPAMSPSTSLTPGQGQGGGSDQEWNYDPN